MMNPLNELAAIQLALDIETRGWEFYKGAAAITQNPDHKELFLLLMTEEYRHRNTFQDLYDQYAMQNAALPSFPHDCLAYLNTLLETHVFPTPVEAPAVLAQLSSLDALLQTALQAEKNLVLLYDELAVQAQLPKAKEVFTALKREEQDHVVKSQEIIRGWA
jgi:rubrerythrin